MVVDEIMSELMKMLARHSGLVVFTGPVAAFRASTRGQPVHCRARASTGLHCRAWVVMDPSVLYSHCHSDSETWMKEYKVDLEHIMDL